VNVYNEESKVITDELIYKFLELPALETGHLKSIMPGFTLEILEFIGNAYQKHSNKESYLHTDGDVRRLYSREGSWWVESSEDLLEPSNS